LITKKFATTTETYTEKRDIPKQDISRTDINQISSPRPVNSEEISIVNGMLLNDQYQDPFSFYDEVVSTELDLPPTTEISKNSPVEKFMSTKVGKERYNEKEKNFVNNKLDHLYDTNAEKEDKIYSEILQHFEQHGESPYFAYYDVPGISFGSRTQSKNKGHQTSSKNPYIKDSSPLISYLHELSILSGEDYIDDGSAGFESRSFNDTTLCFCCNGQLKDGIPGRADPSHYFQTIDDYSSIPHYSTNTNKSRKRRAIRITDPLKSRLIYENLGMLRNSLNCQNQEPIIVKLPNLPHPELHINPRTRLSFDKHKVKNGDRLNHREEKNDIYYVPTKIKSNRQLKDRIRHSFYKTTSKPLPRVYTQTILPKEKYKSSHRGYYDPTKLSFTFSTPSSVARRFLNHRDKDIVTKVPFLHNGGANDKSHQKPYNNIHIVGKSTNNFEARTINYDYSLNDVFDINNYAIPASTSISSTLPSLSVSDVPTTKKTTSFIHEDASITTTSSLDESSKAKTSRIIDPLGLSIFRLLRG
jgi:hypothetical protein